LVRSLSSATSSSTEIRDHQVQVGVGWERAQVAQRRQLAGHVAARAGDEESKEGDAVRLAETARDAEVEQDGPAVGLHEEVAAVQVSVEDAVEHRPLEARDQPCPQERAGVDAGGLHRLDVVERESA
jgi:hypothetical protein